MKSLEAIKMSKLNKKNLETIDSSYDESRDFRGIKDGVKDSGPFPSADQVSEGMKLPSAKQAGSLDVLKTTKATSVGKFPTVNSAENPSLGTIDQLESQPFLKSKKVPYSPIKSYLRKGK